MNVQGEEICRTTAVAYLQKQVGVLIQWHSASVKMRPMLLMGTFRMQVTPIITELNRTSVREISLEVITSVMDITFHFNDTELC
jgi:2-hydroxychromene-2-carboxylate isomerase